jgi:acyl-CoA thioester hydrolase
MYQHETNVRVRYAETDQMGYVYYGNYATYYEIARVEALRELGLRYKDLEEGGIAMPVIQLQAKYLRPARYDELLKIKLTIPTLPTARILFTYDIFNSDSEYVHQASTELTFINMQTGKITRAPDEMIEVLKPFF